MLGGLLQCVLMVLFPQHFGTFVFGASAGVMGIFAIFARLEAHSIVRLNFILPIRTDVLLWITAAISLFFTLVPSQRGGSAAHAAHLGGLLAGLAWVKFGWAPGLQNLAVGRPVGATAFLATLPGAPAQDRTGARRDRRAGTVLAGQPGSDGN